MWLFQVVFLRGQRNEQRTITQGYTAIVALSKSEYTAAKLACERENGGIRDFFLLRNFSGA